MNQIRIMRSFVAADALADLIQAEYNLEGPVHCKLFSKMLRTQDNDHYKVTTGNGEKYVVRVYQFDNRLGRQESDYLYEVDWLNYLHQAGLPVSYPIPRADGRLLSSLNAPEGLRYYALFSLASGRPMSLKNEEHLFVLGREMARIHLASNDYQGKFERQPMNLEFLVDKPIERIKQYWDEDRANDLEILMISAEEAKEEIQALINNEQYTPDGWGPIGGDFHSSSVFFTKDNQPTFFNFDLCGMGWRAYDIAVFLFNTNLIHSKSPELSEAFFAGYYSQRQLSDNEHAAIAPFLTIRRIWQTGLFSMNDGLVGHTFIAPAHN
ncbi:MAG: phosphotransferase [Ardenticatenaceae bacterium]|nr:phosphotransferase [Anaerolineales bacterium]MCB8937785.1 phosphotransferase [Ardenticatenaceae bacterium]MCB8974354.1 phosphotransferase [Ardenticatenaceae bacterium]